MLVHASVVAHPATPLGTERNAPEVEAAHRAVPPEMVAEIIEGELHVMPRPGARHARGASRLGRYLGPFDDDPGPGGWILLDEPELHLGPGPDKLVPDLAGWRRERMPELPDVAAFSLVPDWICEVISPSTEVVDRVRKRRIYRREGVGHLWLLDPQVRTLEVYRLAEGRWLEIEVYEGDAKVRAEPFESVEIDLGLLWAR